MLISEANVPRRGIDRHQVLEREPLDRLANRRATDPQLAAEHVLVDRRAGGDPQGHEAVAQLGVGAVCEQPRGACAPGASPARLTTPHRAGAHQLIHRDEG